MMQTDAQVTDGTILLVDTRCTVLRRFGDTLQLAGFHVTRVASFEEAKHALVAHHPELVITSVRLGAFNGLHLLHLARLAEPDVASIIIASGSDLVLKDDAERLGATVLVEPVHTGDLLTAAGRLFDGRQRVRPPSVLSERRRGERRQMFVEGFVPERRVADRRVATPVGVARAQRTIV